MIMYASHSLILPKVTFLWYNEPLVSSFIHHEAYTSFLYFPFAFLSFFPTSPSPSSQLKSIDLNGLTWPFHDGWHLTVIHYSWHASYDKWSGYLPSWRGTLVKEVSTHSLWGTDGWQGVTPSTQKAARWRCPNLRRRKRGWGSSAPSSVRCFCFGGVGGPCE